MHDLVYFSMSWRARCAVFWVKCSRDQWVWFKKGSLCLAQFLICLHRVKSPPPVSFIGDSHCAVIDGTVELEVFALAHFMNQHCKCFLNASGFMVFSQHVARVLPLELFTFCPSDAICTTSLPCTTLAYVKTAVHSSAFAMYPQTIAPPIALCQQTIWMLHQLTQ